MSHQAYGPRTGVPRLLRLLDRQGIRATFFVPGYTAERWPDAVRAIRDAGHEIAHHGYLHEGVAGTPDPATEERRLLRGLEALEAVAGVRPIGYRAPMWELVVRAAGAPRAARVPLRLGADGRRPPVPAGGRRPSRMRPTIVELPGALGARRLGALQLPARASPARA